MKKPPEAKVTDRLFATYVSQTEKCSILMVSEPPSAQSSGGCYEQGLQDGLVTRTTGPDA